MRTMNLRSSAVVVVVPWIAALASVGCGAPDDPNSVNFSQPVVVDTTSGTSASDIVVADTSSDSSDTASDTAAAAPVNAGGGIDTSAVDTTAQAGGASMDTTSAEPMAPVDGSGLGQVDITDDPPPVTTPADTTAADTTAADSTTTAADTTAADTTAADTTDDTAAGGGAAGGGAAGGGAAGGGAAGGGAAGGGAAGGGAAGGGAAGGGATDPVAAGGGSSSAATGYEISGTCYAECADASTDADDSGATDGWGYENGASCIVAASEPAQGATARCDAGGGGATSGGGTTDTGSTGTDTGSTGTDMGGGASANGDGACPSNLQCPSGIDCGCYTVQGLGANKQVLLNAGASVEMLASAMLETEKMDTNYAYGDNKTGDSFNAGTCKQNWYMMRQCHSAWNNLGPNDYAISDAMNSDPALDVQVYSECRSHFGNTWLAGHRNGQSGVMNPNTADIQRFTDGYNWTVQQIASHTSDDVRFWVDLAAIIVD